jgi:hypothetical protein
MPVLIQSWPVTLLRKHPAVIERVSIDWAPFAGTASIVSSECLVASGSCTLGQSGIDGSYTTHVLIQAGTDGTMSYVENRVTLDDARRDVATVIVDVKDAVP